MYFGVPTPSGVKISERRSSEVGPGAVAPVPNWKDLLDVPERYLKIEDGAVLLKSQEERDLADVPYFDIIKDEIREAIFAKTHAIRAEGFVWDDETFSLSLSGQASWISVNERRKSLGESMFPYVVSARNGLDYTFATAEAYDTFFSAIFEYVVGLYAGERDQVAILEAIEPGDVADLRAYSDLRG